MSEMRSVELTANVITHLYGSGSLSVSLRQAGVAALFRSRLHENFPIYTTLRVIRTISPRGSTVVLDGVPPGAQETYIPLFLGRFRSAPSSILSVARQSDGMRRQKQQSLQPSPPSPACLSSRSGSGAYRRTPTPASSGPGSEAGSFSPVARRGFFHFIPHEAQTVRLVAICFHLCDALPSLPCALPSRDLCK